MEAQRRLRIVAQKTWTEQWTGLTRLAPSFHGELSSLEHLKHLPACVVTGDKDRLVPVKDVRRLVDEMKRLNMDVLYKEIKGGRHFGTITRNPEMMDEVFDFFDQYTRETQPESSSSM